MSHQESSPADPAIDNQIRQNQAELEAKKQDLFQQRLSIIKSSGEPNWDSTNPVQNLSPPPQAAPPQGLVPAITPIAPGNANAIPMGMK